MAGQNKFLWHEMVTDPDASYRQGDENSAYLKLDWIDRNRYNVFRIGIIEDQSRKLWLFISVHPQI